jgi:sec-independent protein translocase protein TatB
MFDITSSKLLILAVIALLVVGPKDLPLLLRTVGKYLGVIRRHANEFRAQLDEAIREAELHELRKEFADVGREMKSTMDEGARAIDTEVEGARFGISRALEGSPPAATGTGEAADGDAAHADAAEAPQRPEKTGT